ncbi:MAG: type ISP restriction/modification enzyme [Pseudomonadota bacterium]
MRLRSQSEFEKGEYFERLVKVFLENDDHQSQFYDKVWHYRDWATEKGLPAKDIGIDLVASHADGSGFCAVQCKFYAPDHSIQKVDIDSFVSAASTKDFISLVLVDTTLRDLSPNAQAVFDNVDREYHRIALADLEKSRIDWPTYLREERVAFAEPKTLRDHQVKALEAVRAGLTEHDRGKLIMACGTGKTFTGLKIAEDLAGKGKTVLFMVPSLALMSQSVREWKNDCADEFLAFSVCSDVKVGKRQKSGDAIQFTVHDLAFPATTDPAKIAEQVGEADKDKMTVVFSTYQSIQTISEAQQVHGLPEFDLIICDEAHRTTGATLSGEDESNFVRIHSNEHVAGRKRLYMTATPKVFGENAKTKAQVHAVELASMDDEEKFGKILFHRGFAWAVENNLLSDYKVIVLAVDEGVVSGGVQNRLAVDNEMNLDDATKIVGCYKALTKQNLIGEETETPKPMKRALAFCKDIATSKMVTGEFSEVVKEFVASEDEDDEALPALSVETRHVDGTFNAKEREDCLDWLKDETDADICRILTNARCLSEGVDVPALDAIMFLHPRNSQIDVIQSVGRVMRKAPGKDMGYVILPVAVPAGVKPEDALNDNERYRVVWQILNALRAHDDRFDAMINQADLGEDISSKIEIIGVPTPELEATTAVVEDFDLTKSKAEKRADIGSGSGDSSDDVILIDDAKDAGQMGFIFDELTQAIRAKIVEKCGTREYWDTWAKDIAKIAQAHITRITTITAKEGSTERTAFLAFLEEIRDDLNPEISEGDAIEMLAQHLITKPVFDTLFKDNEFTRENPVSKAMETVLGQLDEHNLGKEAETLEKFYASVQRRAEGIKTATGRQTLVYELYDKFFRSAFPAMTQKLGIVYTPVEVVDFIIHSVNDVLQAEFGQTLGSKGVHILDPFTGTGTFITRLLQSGLIKPEELEHKYRNEIHANEIVLLAYYIAAINIEAVYHDLAGAVESYSPFEGIILTDTFQLYEQENDMVADLLPDNSERRTKQKSLDIRVIIGNPPYSAGQNSANDNAANIGYPNLDNRIADTYAAYSTAVLKNAVYDSYIRAFRWASDRLGEQGGVIAYVSNAGWIDGKAMDGVRKCLPEDFSNIYVFHLRGNQRTSGEQSRKEGGKIFGSGSRAPIAITILVKKPSASMQCEIMLHDIGDYLSQFDKLSIIRQFGSLEGIANRKAWKSIETDEDHNWVNLGDKSFKKFIPIGSKKTNDGIFRDFSAGVKTNRDAWCYNSSKAEIERNMGRMISFYNSEVDRYQSSDKSQKPDDFIVKDPKKISWDRVQRNDVSRGKQVPYNQASVVPGIYRPFFKEWMYFDSYYNNCVYQMPRLFPNPDARNRVIALSGTGFRGEFSALMADMVPSLNFADIDNNQCFPLRVYENNNQAGPLFGESGESIEVVDGITDAAIKHFQDAYSGQSIGKEQLFYYIYGLLHSPEYRTRFKNNMTKELPRIPSVRRFEDFLAFSEAGRQLGDLHVGYEEVDPYPVVIKEGDLRLADIPEPETFYRVEKMKFGGKGKEKDKTIVHYNPQITMTEIPLRAYDYIVNGKPALEWVMERQCVKTDKASGIVNDANRYAVETVGDPAYPLKLFQRVISVSLHTLDIVENLPPLDID